MKRIILIHGMGTHPKGNMKEEFKRGMKTGLSQFGLSGGQIEFGFSKMDVIEYNFSEFFDEKRKELAEYADATRRGLSVSPSNWVERVHTEVTKVGQGLDDGSMLATSWLDVALYCNTYLGEMIRSQLATLLCQSMKEFGNDKVHVVAHSLGTSLLHDTLHKLFRDDSEFRDGISDYPVGEFNIESVWWLANVSRLTSLVSGQKKPYESRAINGRFGCIEHIVNVANKYDPFTWLRQYDPTQHPQHVPSYTRNIEQTSVKSWNPHKFENYVAHPEVAIRMIQRFSTLDVSRYISDESVKEAVSLYEADSLPGAVEELGRQIRPLTGDPDSIKFKDIVTAVKKVFDEVNELKEEYERDNKPAEGGES